MAAFCARGRFLFKRAPSKVFDFWRTCCRESFNGFFRSDPLQRSLGRFDPTLVGQTWLKGVLFMKTWVKRQNFLSIGVACCKLTSSTLDRLKRCKLPQANLGETKLWPLVRQSQQEILLGMTQVGSYQAGFPHLSYDYGFAF